MKNRTRIFYGFILFLFVLSVYADPASGFNPISYFKENGKTNWQYVANFSSAVLILLLSGTAITLFFSHRKTKRINRELREIRGALEQRVLERTATLAESNQRLQDEVAQHKKTSALLLASEAYITNILESMPSMLIGLNSQMNITQWNLSAEEITGINHDKALGKNLWAVYPAITISPDQVEKVIKEQKPAIIKHNQRGQYYFDITIYPLKGHVEAGVVILIDNVTQRCIAENKLIQRDKMSSMGELASSMAHDIDIPLQAIFKDLADIQNRVKPGENGDGVEALLNNAKDRARQASKIIKNLLDFAQSNQRNKTPEDITDIIDHTLELANNAFSSATGLYFKDIEIKKDYQDNLPGIPCYKTEMQQVFLSLFRHAFHAMVEKRKNEEYSPAIKIKVMTGYDSLWIKIQHNGLGLTGEEQHQIFEPFFHDRLSAKSAGPENRLSFSQFIIVEHHKGHIFVTSDVDIGTTFHIELELPRSSAKEVLDGTRDAQQQKPG